jgi:GTP pyrophosphokinase
MALRFVLTVKDRAQVELLLRQLVKLPYVIRAHRVLPVA